MKDEVENRIRELGETACLEVGIPGIHPELQNLLGRLQYRTSLRAEHPASHSIEVAHLAGMIAAELGLDQKLAKRCGLLHDIGKAIDHEHEGTHPQLGMEVAQRYGEPQPVLEAIGYHHDDYAGGSLWPVLVSAADAISGARPGARRESLEIYIKRLEALEKIANGFPGVEKSYAIQAGREVRIMVEHNKVDDGAGPGAGHRDRAPHREGAAVPRPDPRDRDPRDARRGLRRRRPREHPLRRRRHRLARARRRPGPAARRCGSATTRTSSSPTSRTPPAASASTATRARRWPPPAWTS